jgi:hypothetical protein
MPLDPVTKIEKKEGKKNNLCTFETK